MINANELRLGNWVNLRVKKGSWFGKVTAILDAEAIHIGDDIRAELRLIYPVPLTTDILKKSGFESSRNEYYNLNGFTVIDCDGLFVNAPNNIPVKHVHTLQNLYFAVCNGQELKITL